MRKIVLVGCLAMLCGATSAQAATYTQDSVIAQYTGGGVANTLTVTDNGPTLTFADSGETITTSVGGCSGSGTNSITCPDPLALQIATAGGVDHVTVTRSEFATGIPVTFIDGGAGDDVLTGGPESDAFLSANGDGNDTLNGGGGVNVADYSAKSAGVTIHLDTAGAGNGVSGENDSFDTQINAGVGSAFVDAITGGAAANRIDAYDGADVIDAGGGDDRIGEPIYPVGALVLPNGANDTVADVIDAGSGADTIAVSGGDTVHAGDGNDTVRVISDFGSADTIFGDGGDDTITPGFGNDIVDGGDGADTITGVATAGAFPDDDSFAGGAGDDIIRGLAGNDTLDGGAGSDQLEGAGGADTITGGAGNDTIDAGVGNDTVRAADGERDDISCGGGADDFNGDPIDAVGADCEVISGGAVALGTPPAPGPQGPPGPAGASAPPTPFVLVVVDRRLSGRRGKRVALRYVSTLAGAATLVVKRGSKTVATIKGRAKADVNTIAWNGKQGSRRAAKGAYGLTLTVVSLDGRTKTATARVTLR